MLLGATLVTLTATACNSTGGASVSTEAKQTASASTTKAADAPHAPAPAKVGDTIALKGMDKGNTADVTAVKVVDPAESASEYLKPADGKHYVAVQFQIKATGAQAYSEVPASSAKVVDTQGQAYGPNLEETKAGPAFQTPTNIAPGDTGKGFVTFEVPDGTKLDKVQFALDNGFSQQTGQWKIG
ncbi:hypothetical protein VM98_26355 [Streptomyces rubellomurinus subsp. indigoferus]|uniref:DUF4352 domain-containing protein n=1 Tax=Streptomyces rubellomurinus (strain ATCC 31215) TaxID=359131 RepID=A0A0F2TA55_STRR3|nr:hypothetical protein VM98_26355 [Streptomyces rubellomurinus subsp. indigoferus]KJS58627.1 hypothetical protein VM95_32215 [Streptomyces rubellomurinus]